MHSWLFPFLQDVSEEKCVAYPKLYVPGQKDVLFNKKSFVLKLFHGIVTSCLLYFIPYGVFNRATTPDGIDLGDTEFFSTVVACCLVVTVNLQVCTVSGLLLKSFITVKALLSPRGAYLIFDTPEKAF